MHIFIHLLNDFSGSPRIINEKIDCYQKSGVDCFIVTGGTNGFIRTSGYPHRIIPYKKHSNKMIWAWHLLFWHLQTFLFILRIAGKADVVHCNTLLTAPHLLAAKIKGARTVSHIMETRITPKIHKRIMAGLVSCCADRLVYLSEYVKVAMKDTISGVPSKITYPCVDPVILNNANDLAQEKSRNGQFTVGLICSLIWFKGYREFIQLASICPDLRFVLVLNGTAEAFYGEFNQDDLPSNLVVYFSLKDVSVALAEMDILLSLTQRTGWVETFGLTLIEAMAFGIPVVAPDIGAPTEYIRHGVNGYLIDETDMAGLSVMLEETFENAEKLLDMSNAARETAQGFTPSKFLDAVRSELDFITS
ncbi:glycosyltransferase family 4 protein [Sphingorhabdus lacus]|uniref:glycosyltransferase family 4 protein n=1 Tax=Sphingorhabdus lacus TaxID=392610 RepID=UPI0035933899